MSPAIHAIIRRAIVAAALAAPLACGSEGGARQANAATRRAEREGPAAHRVGIIYGLLQPESVKYDPDQDVYFITNMLGFGWVKDGAGYIVRVEASDFSRMRIFAEGGKNGVTLNAPKGMALHGDTLWVTDIDVLRAFDRRSGAPLATVDLRPQNAVLLNDVAVGPDGALRVTDSGIIMSPKGILHPGGDRIFVVGPGRSVSVQAEGAALDRPNGIIWEPNGKRWVVVSFDRFAGEFATMAPGPDSSRRVIRTGPGQLDGVQVRADGALLFSSWADSSIHLLKNGRDARIIRQVPEAAAIGWDAKRHRVLVPLATLGWVQVWEIPERSAR